jgi:ubiquinone/menaquinone biosynthesis C-methylase UbiE
MRRFVLWFYNRLYTDLAWTYDFTTRLVSGGLWNEWSFAVKDFIIEEPVLEVGTGTGHLLLSLAKHGYQIVGLELSTQMTRAAMRRLRRDGLEVALIQAKGQAVPFAEASFGTVITAFPASYAYDSETHNEFARVLRPNGYWIWVDAPFEHRMTPRMLALFVLTHLAGLKSSAFCSGDRSPLSAFWDTFCRSEPDVTWYPRIDPTQFEIIVKRVPVKKTSIHVAVLQKQNQRISKESGPKGPAFAKATARQARLCTAPLTQSAKRRAQSVR